MGGSVAEAKDDEPWSTPSRLRGKGAEVGGGVPCGGGVDVPSNAGFCRVLKAPSGFTAGGVYGGGGGVPEGEVIERRGQERNAGRERAHSSFFYFLARHDVRGTSPA